MSGKRDDSVRPRIFTNELRDEKTKELIADWKKAEATVKELNNVAEELEDTAKHFIALTKQIEELSLEAYKYTPKTDALYYESPLSPARLTLYMRQQLKLLDWPGIRDVHVPGEVFTKNIRAAGVWLLKLKNDK